MSVLRRLTWLAFPLLSMAFNVQANTAPAQLNKAELEQRFAKLGLQVEEIKTSDINGLLEVQTSGGVLFSSPDGEHFIAGTLYALDGNGGYVDVLAKRQAPLNAKKIAALQDSMIEFKAPNEKYAITVFTDITCGYCVRLHSQIKEYNDLGITVRYLAYPRQGPQGQVADQMAAIWCSNDPKAAMHDAKVIVKPLPPIKISPNAKRPSRSTICWVTSSALAVLQRFSYPMVRWLAAICLRRNCCNACKPHNSFSFSTN